MKLVILCLCLTSTASAAPSFFHYLNHYAGSRQQSQPTQVRNTHPLGLSVPPLPGAGAYSVELIYPHSYAGGANPSQPFTGYGLIKYSIPQPAGRQSVEVYYPYDFSQQRIMTNSPPMSNSPHVPNALPFDFPPQNIPQQTANVSPLDASTLPSQGPMQHIQQDQPTPTNKMPYQV
ncbi:secretory calcium-binding phosphoprotein 5 [Scomber scombrus]|uniref:Secretory calcium-binding phosphoprotein 5 n=1 Tax=Scomber scombrus TaxID=13677 RepID=A0AAV1NHN8_SCOSC